MSFFSKLFRTSSDTPNCEEVCRFLAEYMDGALSEETQADFESHMEQCSACLMHFEQYKSTIQLVREESEIPIPDRLVEHTLDFLKKRLHSSM